jgi:hypothetical protein|tara:strand:+ start:141 stop:470 length:330 start_codon:yes stop_codon:yes gene_type:complete
MRILVLLISFFMQMTATYAYTPGMTCNYTEKAETASVEINEDLKTITWKVKNKKTYELKIVESNEYYIKARGFNIILSIERLAKTFIVALASLDESDELGAEYFTGVCS